MKNYVRKLGKEADELIEYYLDDNEKEGNNRLTYKSALKGYFLGVGIKSKRYFKLENKERIYDDLREYLRKMKVINKILNEETNKFEERIQTPTPNTFHQRLKIIKGFLEDYEIEFSKKQLKKLRIICKRKGVITQKRNPTKQDLRIILQHCKSVKAKAFILCMASSGMRDIEATNITFDDIDLDVNPVKIIIPAGINKNKRQRICFISNEAKESLLEWRKVRKAWLKVVSKKTFHFSKFKKDVNDNRIFPFNTHTARNIWNNLIEKADFGMRDKNTNRHLMNIHRLRGFFIQEMKLKVPIGIIDCIVGHQTELGKAYENYDAEKLGEEYLKGEMAISIYENSENTNKVLDEVTELRQQLEKTKKDLLDLSEVYNREVDANNNGRKPIAEKQITMTKTEFQKIIEETLKAKGVM